MRRTGVADLPLHGGRAPPWLFKRMTALARGIVDILADRGGPGLVLRRVSDPFWFQSLSCVLGFDWHSSGTTTVSCGALKEAVDPDAHGLAVTGGKGRAGMRTPQELAAVAGRFGLDGDALCRASRLAAKVDNAAVQDGHAIYHHTFWVSVEGEWAVVQQGMDAIGGYARRYHWLSDGLERFSESPHVGILGDDRPALVLDMTAPVSDGARKASLEAVRAGPRELRSLWAGLCREAQTSLDDFTRERVTGEKGGARSVPPVRFSWVVKGYSSQQSMPHHLPSKEARSRSSALCGLSPSLDPPRRCEGFQWRPWTAFSGGPEGVLSMPRQIDWGAVAELYDRQVTNYDDLLDVRGIGPATVRALALVADLVYGEAPSWKDPVRYSFAVGGKDGVPYPVDRRTYDETVAYIAEGIERARVGDRERLRALERLRGLAPAVDR